MDFLLVLILLVITTIFPVGIINSIYTAIKFMIFFTKDILEEQKKDPTLFVEFVSWVYLYKPIIILIITLSFFLTLLAIILLKYSNYIK